MNGTMSIVTSNPGSIPPLRFITSSGYPMLNDEEDVQNRLPTDKDMQVLTPSQAQHIFKSTHATRIDGANFLVNDPSQLITHYYHYTAELLFGLWRTYSSLDPYITADGHTTLPPPRRLIFNHVNSTSWRDYAAMNQWVTRGAFPSISFEFSDDWTDRASMDVPFVFERVVLADRAAASNGPFHAKTWRTASEAFALRGSPHWWDPIRANVLAFSGLAPEWIYGPGMGLGRKGREQETFVITYVSRQAWGRRMLRQGDHDALVGELYGLRNRYGYEVNVVNMDKLSRAEQFQLAGRTTVSGVLFIPFYFFVCVLGERFGLPVMISFADHDGRTRQRPHLPRLDATHASFNSHRVLLRRRLCIRLRVHHTGARHGTLRRLV